MSVQKYKIFGLYIAILSFLIFYCIAKTDTQDLAQGLAY
jgi:hypothetical protein